MNHISPLKSRTTLLPLALPPPLKVRAFRVAYTAKRQQNIQDGKLDFTRRRLFGDLNLLASPRTFASSDEMEI